jgi:hypothetical protein
MGGKWTFIVVDITRMIEVVAVAVAVAVVGIKD